VALTVNAWRLVAAWGNLRTEIGLYERLNSLFVRNAVRIVPVLNGLRSKGIRPWVCKGRD